MESPRIVLLGRSGSAEMAPVLRALEQMAASAEIRRVESIGEAVEHLATGDWHPDLVVVCQHWPDEFSLSDVRRLLGAFPLARFVCCYGPWCASDGRTRSIWPLAVRVPAEGAEGRIRGELDVIRGERPPLPLTASRDEIFLFDSLEPAGERGA